MMKFKLTLLLCFSLSTVSSQIIDAHLHSYTNQDYWGGSPHRTGVTSPKSADEHLSETIAYMDKHGIEHAVISGSVESIGKYTAADPRFIPAYSDGESLIPVAEFESLVKAGKIKVFGEIMAVYEGRTLNDPIYQAYLEICEKYGVPVGYHTGGGPPMSPYKCCPNFRISKGDPLLIEDVLVKYPKLKVYLMHGGEVFFEHAIRMMSMYQHLYLDLGVILWGDPVVKDYAVRLLKLAKNANVLDRVLFGTDQMVWPGAISQSLEFFNSLDFLTEEEKKMILFENSKQFFEL